MPGNSLIKKIFLYAIIAATIAAPAISFAQEAAEPEFVCDILGGAVTGCILNGLAEFVKWVGNIVSGVSAFLISIAASFIQVLITASKNLLASPLVTAGFRITLDLANLGFVFAIIVIAFATILRFQGYGMKDLLWKLVTSALLVNFSFVIAGTIIDFNNVLGNFFLDAASPGNISTLTSNLANTGSIQKLAGITPATGEITGFVRIAIQLVAINIFNGLLVVVFFAIAFMLLIRYVYLNFLLILMPLAWLFRIFPTMSKYWGQWWIKFLQWNFFYPGVAFFIYLAIFTSDAIQKATKAAEAGSAPSQSATLIAGLPGDAITTFLQILLQVGILFGGLMAAQSFGIVSTGAVMGAAKGTARWVVGAVGKPAIAAGRAVGAARITTGVGRAGATLLSSKWVRWVPGAKTAAANLSSWASRKEDVEDYKKRYFDKLSGKALETSLQGPLSLDPVANAARLAKAIEEKKLDLLTKGLSEPERKKRLAKFAASAKTTDPSLLKKLTAAYPSYAPDLTGDTLEATLSKSKGSEINKDELAKVEVAQSISHTQISDIYREGIPEKINILQNALRQAASIDEKTQNALKDNEQKISEIVDAISEAKERGVDEKSQEIKDLRARLGGLRNIHKGLYTPKDEKQRQAYEKLQLLRQKPKPV